MKPKILVIEDDNIIRNNIVEILELSGYCVENAHNGKIGVELAQSFCPDLIVSDIMMPELDGFGVLHILSRNKKTAHIPFIFLTAKSEKIDFRKGMELGADDYITKPFENLQLLNAIESRLKKYSHLKEVADKPNIETSLNAPQSLEDLIDSTSSTIYKTKEHIYRAGDHSNYAYFIKKGKVKIVTINEDGKEFISEVLESNGFFGGIDILDNCNRTAYAICLEDVELVKIRKQDFLSTVLNNKENAQEILENIAHRWKEKEQQLVQMAYESVKKRIAVTLHNLLKDKGETNISRTDLSNMIGTSTETVVRMIGEMKKEGVLTLEGHTIALKDEKKLSKMIEWL